MKIKFKVISILVVFILSFGFFVSCNNNKELTKVSKNLTEYTISAGLDGENMVVNASQKVDFINKYDVSLDKMCFNLYARAFREDATIKPYTTLNEGKCFPNGKNFGDLKINNVLIDGKQVEYSFVGEDDNALEIKLLEEIEPRERVIISINFDVYLAECVHRLGYYNNNINLGNWFPILAEYENGEFVIEPYYSTGDPFYSDIANYKVDFTYPSEYNLFSSGEEKTINCKENSKKDTISAFAVRDFAIFLSKDSTEKSVKNEDVNVSYIGYSSDENIDYCLSVASKALHYFSNTFGNYPYKSLEIVKAPFLHGGMEYPSVVIVSDNIIDKFDLAKVIVHEIAHQWWYAVVGNNEISESWLDESLAEYSTILFFSDHKEFDVTYEELISEAFASYTLFADISSTLNKKINTSMLLKVNEYTSEYEYSYMIYVRGVLMFDSIKEVVKEDKIKQAFKKYYSKYKFKFAKTDDLISVINSVTRKNVDIVMDSWLKGKTVIGSI